MKCKDCGHKLNEKTEHANEYRKPRIGGKYCFCGCSKPEPKEAIE